MVGASVRVAVVMRAITCRTEQGFCSLSFIKRIRYGELDVRVGIMVGIGVPRAGTIVTRTVMVSYIRSKS